jgi:hypothetical protein
MCKIPYTRLLSSNKTLTLPSSASGLYDQALSESIIDSFDFDVPEIEAWTGMKERWVCIEGGSSTIITGMLRTLRTAPSTSKRVTSIAIERSRTNPAHNNMRVCVSNEKSPRYYSTVFTSTTLGAAQRIDLSKAELHPIQKDAIRSLRYDSSCKVAIRFKTAWWIKAGIKLGGTAKTDRPIRTCVYPSYNTHDDPDKPAVLLCSYTWGQDAQRMGTLITAHNASTARKEKDSELRELILKDLSLLHANFISLDRLREQFLSLHAHDWYTDANFTGAVPRFGPTQFRNLYPFLARPTADGNLHFIGEATSTHHAWVVGALNAAYRGVFHMLKKYQMEKTPMRRHWQRKIDELREKWGVVDEIDTGVEGTAHLQVMLGRVRAEEMVGVDY